MFCHTSTVQSTLLRCDAMFITVSHIHSCIKIMCTHSYITMYEYIQLHYMYIHLCICAHVHTIRMSFRICVAFCIRGVLIHHFIYSWAKVLVVSFLKDLFVLSNFAIRGNNVRLCGS